MTETTDQNLIALTQELLDCIVAGDWPTYQRLCAPTLSAFEPEACSNLVVGMEFHRFYFDLQRPDSPTQTTMMQPHVRRLGDDVAVVSYVRLIQYTDPSDQPHTACFEETRVWHREDTTWRNVHFHRSGK